MKASTKEALGGVLNLEKIDKPRLANLVIIYYIIT